MVLLMQPPAAHCCWSNAVHQTRLFPAAPVLPRRRIPLPLHLRPPRASQVGAEFRATAQVDRIAFRSQLMYFISYFRQICIRLTGSIFAQEDAAAASGGYRMLSAMKTAYDELSILESTQTSSSKYAGFTLLVNHSGNILSMYKQGSIWTDLYFVSTKFRASLAYRLLASGSRNVLNHTPVEVNDASRSETQIHVLMALIDVVNGPFNSSLGALWFGCGSRMTSPLSQRLFPMARLQF